MIRRNTSSAKRAAIAMVVMAAAACGAPDGGPSARPTPAAESCRVRLAQRQSAVEQTVSEPALVSPPHSSRLVAHVDLRLGALTTELDRNVAPRLAEEKNRPLGMAGHLEFTVDRGPFSITASGDSLVVRTDIRGRARVCRGASCYPSCEPQGRATATVPLRLTSDYRFAPSHVMFAFTRGCEVRALGGLLKIDVTEMIQGNLAPALRRVEREIDGKLPPMRAQAERLWTELGKSRALPLGGCVVVHPQGLVEGPLSSPAPGILRARFGVVAYPELHSRCGEPLARRELPPLLQDPSLPAEDDVVLAFVSPLAVVAAGLSSTDPFDAGGARARIAHAAVVPSGAAFQFDLGLRGEACGDLGVRSPLGWTDDGRALRLTAPLFTRGERERAEQGALAPDVFVRSLAGVRFAPPIAPETLKELLPVMAGALSDPTLTVTARIDAIKPLDVTLRGDEFAASVLVRGRVDLEQR